MNPAEKIMALEEKRGALESQLVVGISEVERIAIHQRIIAIDSQITELWKHVPTPAQAAPALTEPAGMTSVLKKLDEIQTQLQPLLDEFFDDLIPVESVQTAKTERSEGYRDTVQKCYGSTECVVLRAKFPEASFDHKTTCAHILPRNYRHFKALSMAPDDPRNCVFLTRHIEKMMDERKLCFIIESGSEASACMIVRVEIACDKWNEVVMSPELKGNNLSGVPILQDGTRKLKFGDLHGVRVTFTGNVPFRRSLLLMSTGCWLRSPSNFPVPDPDALKMCTKIVIAEYVRQAIDSATKGRTHSAAVAEEWESSFVCHICKSKDRLMKKDERVYYCSACWKEYYEKKGLCEHCGKQHKGKCARRLIP